MANKQKQVTNRKKANDIITKCLVVIPHAEGLSQKANRVESRTRNYTCAARKQSQSEQSKFAIADHAVQNNHVIGTMPKFLEKRAMQVY